VIAVFLPALRALEEAERQRLEVLEELDAQVADHAFLDRHVAQHRRVGERVLEQQRRAQHEHDVSQGGLGRGRREHWPSDST